MESLDHKRHRRCFRWPGAVREMIQAHLDGGELSLNDRASVTALITRVAAVSGNPRSACWRLVRRSGVNSKRAHRPWSRPEQQKLLDLIASRPLQEVTLLLRRSPASVRSMLHKLGANTRVGQDWFTTRALAEALHIRAIEVQKWIDRGWLKCRDLGADGLKRQLIDADAFCDFCKQHRREIVGNRLNVERLDFVQTFVFPPSHAELLPVRNAKKEQAAYEEQMKNDADWKEFPVDELSATA